MANPLLEIVDQDRLKLEVGSILWERFMEGSLNFPPGWNLTAATNWLSAMGFEDHRWVQVDDDTLILLLSYTDEEEKEVSWILEFNGPDGSDISLFNFVREVSN